MSKTSMTKKQQVITDLYRLCRRRGDLRFHNDEVRGISAKIGFANPYDATKWDSSSLLPPALVEDNVFVVHLEEGWHEFMEGISIGYHTFEDVPKQCRYEWLYQRSALDCRANNESDIPYVSRNQGLVQLFVCRDIAALPKVYGPNQTFIPLICTIGNQIIRAKRVQVEIDVTMEYLGRVTVFKAKNGFPQDFNTFQLFNPTRYYTGLQKSHGLAIDGIEACYILREGNCFRFYLYTFDDLERPDSIRLLRNAEYSIIPR